MKSVVLAEKPSAARDIARVLRCSKQGSGYIEGDRYIVTWALGHLVTHADPEAYDEAYKTWRLEDLPMLPAPLKLTVIKQTSKQFHIVKQQLSRKDVDEVIIATDAGREGELVARWILEKAKVRKRVRRLWISSLTDKAIAEGFRRLKDGRQYENLYASAEARAEADWYVGINATRALTCKYNAQLSCGRVQTPTLAIIAKREQEIREFRPRTYYGLKAAAGELTLTWQNQKTKQTRTFDRQEVQALQQRLSGQAAQIIEVDKKHKRTYAPALYDLTELQRDANKLFGFSAKETLAVMQRLYEQHKALTYPRTDSRFLSTDIVATLPERVEALQFAPYRGIASQILKNGIKAHKGYVDDRKVTDHHAIIPTEQAPLYHKLNDRERKIYDLVVKRFLAVLLPPFEYDETRIKAKIGGEHFIAKGKIVTSFGWKEVYGQYELEEEEQEDLIEQSLPQIVEGDSLQVSALTITSGETAPPKRFTEASLLSAMENPAPYMSGESHELIRKIGETGGLGTVATRADIIEKLFANFYIEKRGQEIQLTSKGKQLLDLVPDELKSPAMTAEWEQKLEKIARGNLDKQVFIQEMMDYAKRAVQEIKSSDKTFKHDNLTSTRCTACGEAMLEVKTRRGRMLVCSNRECGHRKNLAVLTNARCPNCRKRMELRGEGEGRIFVCACGYREKLSAYEKRKAREKPRVSKREVMNYLRQQERKQEEPFNTALADALAKFTFDDHQNK